MQFLKISQKRSLAKSSKLNLDIFRKNKISQILDDFRIMKKPNVDPRVQTLLHKIFDE